MKVDMGGSGHSKYPTIRLLVAIGRPLSAIVAAAVALLGIAAFANGYGLLWTSVALGGSIVVFIVLRACIEVLEVISDILLPK